MRTTGKGFKSPACDRQSSMPYSCSYLSSKAFLSTHFLRKCASGCKASHSNAPSCHWKYISSNSVRFCSMLQSMHGCWLFESRRANSLASLMMRSTVALVMIVNKPHSVCGNTEWGIRSPGSRLVLRKEQVLVSSLIYQLQKQLSHHNNAMF